MTDSLSIIQSNRECCCCCLTDVFNLQKSPSTFLQLESRKVLDISLKINKSFLLIKACDDLAYTEPCIVMLFP